MPERKMQITADNETRRGHYSNLALISHRQEEFVVDFLFVDPQAASPQEGQAILESRMILNPVHMKRLYQAIGELRREFADLTIRAAEKVIARSLDTEAHRELVQKVLEESSVLKKK